MNTFANVNDLCHKRECIIFWDGSTTSLCQQGQGRRNRTAQELDEFVEFAKVQMPVLLGLSA
jgi:hypothetical protein